MNYEKDVPEITISNFSPNVKLSIDVDKEKTLTTPYKISH